MQKCGDTAIDLKVLGKGGKVRVLIVPPHQMKELEAIKPLAASPDDFIFCTSTGRELDRFAVYSAIKKVRFYH